MDNIEPVQTGNALSLDQAFERLRGAGNPPAQAETPENQDPETVQAELDPELAGQESDPQDASEPPASGDEPPKSVDLTEETIIIKGKAMTADEFDAGYVPKPEFTRKTQVLAQKEKEGVQRVENAVQQFAAAYQEITSQLGKEPDWEKVAQDRPLDWQLEKLAWDRKQASLQQARTKVEETYKQHAREAQSRMITTLTSGEYDPRWVNQSAFEEDVGKLVKDFQARGIPPARIDQILDPTEFMVAIDAMRYRELVSKKPEIKREVKKSVETPRPKALQPGARTTQQRVPEKVKQAEGRFQQTRGIHEAYDMLIARRGKPA